MRAVLERDYVAEAVRPRAFAARWAPGAFAALVLLSGALTGGALADGDWDRVGAAAFRTIGTALLVFLGVTVPFLFVGSLLVERQRNTLEVLLTTPEGARGAASGKFVARLGTCLGWAAAALPPLTVAVLFGGTSWRALFNTGLGLLAWTLELAAWGLFVSAFSRKLATAAVLAYLLPAAHWLAAGNAFRGGIASVPELLVAAASPISCMDLAAWDRVLAGSAKGALGGWLSQPGLWYLLLAAVLAALAIPAAAAALGREETAPGERGLRIPRSRADAKLRRLLTRGNPVAWKESLLLNTAWSRLLYYMLLGLLFAGEIAVVAFHRSGNWDASKDCAYISVVCGLILAMAALQGAASMAFEKTQGTFDLLRITLLKPEEIAQGKFLGTLLGSGLLLLVPMAHIAFTTLGGYHRPETALLGCATAILMTANAAVHGLTWGTVARTPTTALAGAASFAAIGAAGCYVLCLLPFLLAGLRLWRRNDPSEYLEIVVVPGALGGTGLNVLNQLLPAMDGVRGTFGFGGIPLFGGLFVGALSLVVCVIYLVYRRRRLPEVLRREMARLAEGGDRLFVPGSFVLRPTEDRLADFVRRHREGREGRKP